MNIEERLPRNVELAVVVVSSHLRRTETRPEDFGSLLATAWRGIRSLEGLEAGGAEPHVVEAAAAADSPRIDDDEAGGFVREGRATVRPESITCLDDGREVVFLGRHLRAIGTSEDEYRRKWTLPQDYPMTAPAYVARARASARKSGFGTEVRPDRERGAAPAPAPRARRRGTLAPAFA